MKALLTILIGLVVIYVFSLVFEKYETIKRAESQRERGSPIISSSPTADSLPGLLPTLEGPLAAARQQGAEGLGNFLKKYRSFIQDPRLASIELDYAVLLNLKNTRLAREVYHSVQERTPSSSPVYGRLKSLEGTFQ